MEILCDPAEPAAEKSATKGQRNYTARTGRSCPLGATITDDGVNFAIYSKRAQYLELLLFETEASPRPFATYTLTPEKNRTANYWHIFLEGALEGQVYAYRAYGEFDPGSGLRFDANKVLLDPYSKGIVNWEKYSRETATIYGDNCEASLRSIVVNCHSYDWAGDQNPSIPFDRTVIYELHVGGFTKNPNSGVAAEKRGTYAGLVEKIPYLKELGITTIELMPVQSFDKQDAPAGLTNYWGYSPIGFFAPHMEYSSQKTALGAITEFRDMVKACHANGLEVILDVVFNHTSENSEHGPTLCFKGLDNYTYYTLDEGDYSYKNYSGCGNTLRGEHPIVGRLVLESLRFWAQEMHVDGFRFDLASVMTRDVFGEPVERPPLLWAIESDPALASCKLIAEAWDPAGLYQVGTFVNEGDRFAEWNGPYRDDVRRFVKGDDNSVISLSNRVTGSSDLYAIADCDLNRSINFVTCHDGFTLNDLVTYNRKHNEANLEGDRDGANENFSWNCGFEGQCNDEEVEALRLKQIKNCLAILLLSQGTPMLLMGDEIRRTTFGNNNSYCQNNESNWFDWHQVSHNASLLNFTRKLIELNRRIRVNNLAYGSCNPFLEQAEADNGPANFKWHGTKLGEPDFRPHSHSLALEVRNCTANEDFFLIFNAYWDPLTFQLPRPAAGRAWQKIVDTSLGSPEDFVDVERAKAVSTDSLTVPARTSCVLMQPVSASERSLPQFAAKKNYARPGLTWTNIRKPKYQG
jgi:glycogen operon protein